MSSSDGGGINPALLAQAGIPIPNLPVAGSGANVDPYNYGKFQNFLPDVPSQADFDKGARAPSAMGLTKEMFEYRSPNGTTAPASGGAGGGAGGAGDLRGALAAAMGGGYQGFANQPLPLRTGYGGMPIGPPNQGHIPMPSELYGSG